MNFLSKKARMDFVAKAVIITSIFGCGSYIINSNYTYSIAYADTSATSNKEVIKTKILTSLQSYTEEINFSSTEVISLGIVKGTDTDPQKLYMEVLAEHPEIFYVPKDVTRVSYSDGSMTLYAYYMYDSAEIDSKKTALQSKVQDVADSFSSYSDLRKVYEIHDYVNESVTYDHTTASTSAPDSPIDPSVDLAGYVADKRNIVKSNRAYYESHSAIGALFNGTAVCEGYASETTLLLRASGFEAGMITSATHGWNYVKLNGSYYQIDTTWDDYKDDNTVSPYKYFNISSSEMAKDTDNGSLHVANSYVPSCTDGTFDGIFRDVSSGNLKGKNVVRIKDKLYGTGANGSTYDLYSSDLDGGNKTVIKSGMKNANNAFAYNGNVYFFERLTVSPYVIINKLDTKTGTITQYINLYSDFPPSGSFSYSFYIKDDTMTITRTDNNGTSTKNYTIDDSASDAQALADATTAVSNAESTILQSDLDIAQALVTALKAGTEKDALQVRIDAVQLTINNNKDVQALTEATTAVTNAESTLLQSDLDTAKTLVSGLKAGVDKDTLQARVDAVQVTIDNNNKTKALADATTAVEKAENTLSQSDLNDAKALVDALISGSDKDALLSRISTVQTQINGATVVKATGITISGGNSISVKDGTLTLTATVTPDTATDKTVTWSSSDDTIASVDSNGIVTAKADGSVIITATANDGSGTKATNNISISGQTVVTPPTDVKVTGITITGGNSISVKGGTLSLTCSVSPSNATDKNVTWSSSDSSIASVDSNGTVTAKADGTVIIKAIANDGSNIEETKTITISGQTVVTPPTDIKVTGITISGGNSISVKGGTLALTCNVNPSNATNQGVTWASSDDSIATISSNGVVTAKTNGSVTITATAKDGSGIKGTKTVTITGQTVVTPPADIKITGITISGEDSISVKGSTLALTCSVNPSTATNKTVSWSSSDENIATINSSGVLTAKANGTVTITATANDGSGVKGTKAIAITGQSTTTNGGDASSDSVLKSVSISGTEEVGHKLKAKIKYTGSKPSVEYQWQRASKKDGDYTDISGANEEEYKLKSSDNGKYVKVVVTSTINGTSYDIEDITNKISKDTSNDDENEDENQESSNTTKNNSPTNYNVASEKPANNNIPTYVSNGTRPLMPSSTNASSPSYGQFTNPSGRPVSGWVDSGSNWYYLDTNGYAQVGWVSINGKWYYLSNTQDTNRGVMKTGWIQDNGLWYYLYSDGSMASNTNVDGYRLGADGAWIG